MPSGAYAGDQSVEKSEDGLVRETRRGHIEVTDCTRRCISVYRAPHIFLPRSHRLPAGQVFHWHLTVTARVVLSSFSWAVSPP